VDLLIATSVLVVVSTAEGRDHFTVAEVALANFASECMVREAW
jgi:hypothetical protein